MLKNIWYPTDKLFIGGEWVAPKGGETLQLEDPSDGTPLAQSHAAKRPILMRRLQRRRRPWTANGAAPRRWNAAAS